MVFRCKPPIALLLALPLMACGWQLPMSRDVARRVSPVYLVVDEDAHSEFARALEERLRAAQVALATSAATARVTVNVTAQGSGHHVSAVSALNEPQQYEVYYSITYHITGHAPGQAEQALTPVQTSMLSRTMNYDKTAALAMQRQEQVLQQRLAEDLAEQVMRKLSFVAID